jgi:outer membrane protein assembly factor BamB
MPRMSSAVCRSAVIATLAAASAASCAGDERAGEDAPPPAGDVHERSRIVRVQAAVRVLDGDSGRPVRGAVVRIAAKPSRTDDHGIARGPIVRIGRARARVSAPGYMGRRVTVHIRRRRPASVPIWRRDLQWPLYGATPARTQAHPAIKLRPPFRVLWKQDFGSMLEFPAVVWEGVAYVTNYHGFLTAVSMRDGRVLWRRRTGSVSASSPAVDPERRSLVVTSKEPGRLTVVDMDTGRVRWRFATGRAESSPVIANGVAYFGDESGRMFALDLRRRKPRWVFSGGAKITSSPALVGRRLYFGDYAGRVFALDARTGRHVWTGSAGARVYGTVAVGGGRVFVPSVFTGLSALSARTGRLLWRIPVGVYLYASPAYYRGRVYFGTYAGVVYRADASSGRILWRGRIGGRVSGAIVIVAGAVYAGSLEGRIEAWDSRTGRTLWTFNRGRYVPVSGNGARLLVHGARSIWAVMPKRQR